MTRRLAAATAATLAAVLMAACAGGAKKADSHATTTVAAAVSGRAAGAPAMTWSRLTSPALTIGGGVASTIAAVVAPAPEGIWLAAGTRTNPDGTSTAVVWTSPDGRSWTANQLGLPGIDSRAEAATRSGPRTVVVGSIGPRATSEAAVWLSPSPGAPFVQVNGDEVAPASPAPTQMDVVAAGGLGMFAAGRAGAQQAVWYSADGRHWAHLPAAERAVNAAPGADLEALVVSPSGVFAAGSVPDGASMDAAVWSSDDGITWRRVRSADQSFTGGGDHVIYGLASLGTGLVAVGGVRGPGDVWSPASWISPDGASWSAASLAFPMAARTGVSGDGGGAVVAALSGNANGLVAAGGSTTSARLWTSSDGLDWREQALPATATTARWRADLVAISGGGAVVADNTPGVPRLLTESASGWDEVTTDPAPFGAPWSTATPSRLLSVGGELVLAVNVDHPGQALGSETTSVSLLTSRDGRQWQEAATPSVWIDATVSDLLATPRGFVAVGAQAPVPAVLSSGSPAALAWTSADAISWTTSDVMSGSQTGSGADARAVTELGTRLIAVGEAVPTPAPLSGNVRTQAVAWTSQDARTWQAPAVLSHAPPLGFERPSGACTSTTTVVAVGTGSAPGSGTSALAWSSADGTHWRAARVSPPGAAGERQSIEGCVSSGGGFVAYGGTSGASGGADPVLWQSADGLLWTKQNVSSFTGAGLGPLVSMAMRGPDWLAVSGGDDPSGVSPAGGVVVWESGDGGASWQRMDTSGTGWLGTLDDQALQAAFLGSTAVVCGQVDGRLAVWVGAPASPVGAARRAR